MNDKKKCFVIMPFSDTKSCTEQKWTEIFEYIIKPAVEKSRLGYECERSVAERENIIKGILEALNKANVVIADLTDNNPNVFYELGVRHTLANRTILIAQGEEHIPFDLRPYPVAFYSESPAKIAEFKEDMKKKLEDIEKNPERSDNPVADFLRDRNVVLLAAEKSANVKKLCSLISELSYNITYIDKILDTVKESQQERKKGKGGFKVSSVRLGTGCLVLLQSTSYIILPDDLLGKIISINERIGIVNRRLDLWGAEHFAESVEKKLSEQLPSLRELMESVMKDISKLVNKYENENYQEPKELTVLTSTTEHADMLKEVISTPQ